jgi:hypothetical protein
LAVDGVRAFDAAIDTRPGEMNHRFPFRFLRYASAAGGGPCPAALGGRVSFSHGGNHGKQLVFCVIRRHRILRSADDCVHRPEAHRPYRLVVVVGDGTVVGASGDWCGGVPSASGSGRKADQILAQRSRARRAVRRLVTREKGDRPAVPFFNNGDDDGHTEMHLRFRPPRQQAGGDVSRRTVRGAPTGSQSLHDCQRAGTALYRLRLCGTGEQEERVIHGNPNRFLYGVRCLPADILRGVRRRVFDRYVRIALGSQRLPRADRRNGA